MLALLCCSPTAACRIRQGALTLGVLVAFFQYGLRFFRPIQDLSEKYNILQAAMAASERIFKLLDTSPRSFRRPRPQPFPEGPVDIEFDHVWFAYNGEDWVLRDVSSRRAGETIAIVGHTGAGKTTLDQPAAALLRHAAGSDPHRRRRYPAIRSAGFAPAFRRCAAGSVSVHRHDRQTTSGSARKASPTRKSRRAAERVNLIDFIETLPDGSTARARARQRLFDRPEATDQLRPGAGARSADT